ncbi:YihY/virulence factor BrkB family protein [Terriglobus sp.]|uniref:YihY/virulence factor BrkB family protein n=1 Tax=Terriglobus sp. TaxID=1889013 RepID=UPI003AFFB810
MRQHAQLAREFGEGGLRFTDKVRLAYWNAFQHDCLNTAKATAYSAIFALFPALIVLAALVTFLPYAAPLRYQLALFFQRVLPASVAPLLEHYFINSKSSPQSASVVLGTVVVSITGAAGVLGTLMEGFRRAYLLRDEAWGEGLRGGLRRYLWSVLLVPISLMPFGAVTVLVIFGHFLLPVLRHFLPAGLDSTFFIIANTARWSLAVLVTVAVIAAIYRYGLPVRPRWKQVLPGAAFATGTWFLTTLGFGWYVTHLANYSKTYGSLGTGIILLLWLFLTALSVLCGAELNAELARDHARIQ